MSFDPDSHHNAGQDEETLYLGTLVSHTRKSELPGSDTEVRVFEQVVERSEPVFVDEAGRVAHWENIRALRTELLLRRVPSERSDTITILSPGRGEGRSVLAADLAMAFAQTGARTLLVDANLREPRLHTLFGTRRGPGLSDAVESGMVPVLHSVRGPHSLFLLTAGKPSDDPLEVLSGHNIQPLREFWSAAFQVVIIDTPAAAVHPDALVIASREHCRLLLLTRARHTRNRDLDLLLRRLSTLSAPIAGAVVNHF